MKPIKLLFFLLLFSNCFSYSQSTTKVRDSLWTVEDISNITIYLKQKKLSGSIGGTGTIIKRQNRYFLLTANHVAKEMNDNPQIIFRVNNDEPASIDLIKLTPHNKLIWISHNEADISIIELLPINNDVKTRLESWSFDSKNIFDEKKTIPRDADVTFFGYPILDLDIELKHFSALSFTAYLASGFITTKRYDTKTPCTFYYLDQPSMQGCSGGGVFCCVKKAFYMDVGLKKTLLIGVVHGTANDISGGKLAAITPSFYILELLSQIK